MKKSKCELPIEGMELVGRMKLNLDKIWTDDEKDYIGDILRDEILSFIRSELKREFTDNITFVGKMKSLREKVAARIIDAITKWEVKS